MSTKTIKNRSKFVLAAEMRLAWQVTALQQMATNGAHSIQLFDGRN